MYANTLVYAVLHHGLLHTPGRTGAIYNWYPAFTASPGVLQEITTDPITVCIQHALVNLCKSHNCSWFYNSWTRACSTGRAPASITQSPMSASPHLLCIDTKQTCACVCLCVHSHSHTKTNKAWKCTWVKWLQMWILWVRKIMNLNCGELLLGDTNVFWLLLLFFSYRCFCHQKRLAVGGESTCSLLTASPMKKELHYMLQAVGVPGMPQIKFLLFTRENFLPLPPHGSLIQLTYLKHFYRFSGIFFLSSYRKCFVTSTLESRLWS